MRLYAISPERCFGPDLPLPDEIVKVIAWFEQSTGQGYIKPDQYYWK